MERVHMAWRGCIIPTQPERSRVTSQCRAYTIGSLLTGNMIPMEGSI